jgi:hypothetical protein
LETETATVLHHDAPSRQILEVLRAGAGGHFAVSSKAHAPARKRTRARRPGAAAPAGASTPPQSASEIGFSNLSLHALFEQQAAEILERADIDEEQKQGILLAMSCPCCSGGGPSFTFRLKRRT